MSPLKKQLRVKTSKHGAQNAQPYAMTKCWTPLYASNHKQHNKAGASSWGL